MKNNKKKYNNQKLVKKGVTIKNNDDIKSIKNDGYNIKRYNSKSETEQEPGPSNYNIEKIELKPGTSNYNIEKIKLEPEDKNNQDEKFTKKLPKTKKSISLQKKFFTYALLSKRGITEAFFSINRIMELAKIVKKEKQNLNKLRFYSSSLPRSFQTALLSGIGFIQLYQDNSCFIESVESKITKIPYFSETPQKLPGGIMIEKGSKIRNSRITSRTMSKGQIYAVDHLISRIFRMENLTTTDGEPFHIDYSKLNPTFTLYEDDDETDPSPNDDVSTVSRKFHIIIMRHAESCANTVSMSRAGKIALGTGLGVGASAGLGLGVGAGVGLGLGAGITTGTSMYKYKKQKGGALPNSSNDSSSIHEFKDTKNIYDLTFYFKCIKKTNYYKIINDNNNLTKDNLIKDDIINKGEEVIGKIIEIDDTLYIETNHKTFLEASNFKQIEIYDNSYGDEVLESSKLALLKGEQDAIYNKWEKELVKQVTSNENKDSLLVFVGHGKWIKDCLFKKYVNYDKTNLQKQDINKKGEIQPSNTSTFLLEFELDTDNSIKSQYGTNKKFNLIKSLTHNEEFNTEKENDDFQIECKDGSKYCINKGINENLIQDYITCNYPDDNSPLSIMQLALNIKLRISNELSTTAPVSFTPEPVPDSYNLGQIVLEPVTLTTTDNKIILEIKSFNVEGFLRQDDILYNYINEKAYDILCLQEIRLKSDITEITKEVQERFFAKNMNANDKQIIQDKIFSKINHIRQNNFVFEYDGYTGGILYNKERFILLKRLYIKREPVEDPEKPSKMCLVLFLFDKSSNQNIIIVNIHLKAQKYILGYPTLKKHNQELYNILDNIIKDQYYNINSYFFLAGDFNENFRDEHTPENRIQHVVNAHNLKNKTNFNYKELCCFKQITQHGNRMERERGSHVAAAKAAKIADKLYLQKLPVGGPIISSLDAIISLGKIPDLISYHVYNQTNNNHVSDHEMIGVDLNIEITIKPNKLPTEEPASFRLDGNLIHTVVNVGEVNPDPPGATAPAPVPAPASSPAPTLNPGATVSGVNDINKLFIYSIHFSLRNDNKTVDNTFEYYNKDYKLEKLNNFSLINEKTDNDDCVIM